MEKKRKIIIIGCHGVIEPLHIEPTKILYLTDRKDYDFGKDVHIFNPSVGKGGRKRNKSKFNKYINK